MFESQFGVQFPIRELKLPSVVPAEHIFTAALTTVRSLDMSHTKVQARQFRAHSAMRSTVVSRVHRTRMGPSTRSLQRQSPQCAA